MPASWYNASSFSPSPTVSINFCFPALHLAQQLIVHLISPYRTIFPLLSHICLLLLTQSLFLPPPQKMFFTPLLDVGIASGVLHPLSCFLSWSITEMERVGGEEKKQTSPFFRGREEEWKNSTSLLSAWEIKMDWFLPNYCCSPDWLPSPISHSWEGIANQRWERGWGEEKGGSLSTDETASKRSNQH